MSDPVDKTKNENIYIFKLIQLLMHPLTFIMYLDKTNVKIINFVYWVNIYVAGCY